MQLEDKSAVVSRQNVSLFFHHGCERHDRGRVVKAKVRVDRDEKTRLARGPSMRLPYYTVSSGYLARVVFRGNLEIKP